MKWDISIIKGDIKKMYRDDLNENSINVPPINPEPYTGPMQPSMGPIPTMPCPHEPSMGPMPGMPGMMPPMQCPPQHMSMFMEAYNHVSMAYTIMTQMMQMMRP